MQPKKASWPMLVRLAGRVIEMRDVQSSKALSELRLALEPRLLVRGGIHRAPPDDCCRISGVSGPA